MGTIDKHDDYTTGLAYGAMGAKRINEAISQVLTLFDSYPERDYNRIIDVFGFSRGAAMARDFVNTLPYRAKKEKYEVGFIGVFDTVGSFGNPGDNENWKPKQPETSGISDPRQYDMFDLIGGSSYIDESNEKLLEYEKSKNKAKRDNQQFVHKNFEEYNFHLHASSAQHIVHLTAQDEYRINFPLSDIQGSGGHEYALIGAHSDIGGGYPAMTNETLLHQRSYSSRADTQSNLIILNQQLDEGWHCDYISSERDGIHQVTCKKKREVNDDLQKVALHVMFLLARKGGVPFKNNVLKEKLPEIIKDLGDLEDYRNKTISNPAGAKGYANKALLLEKYVHKSSVGNIPSTFMPEPELFPCRASKDMRDTLANSPRILLGNNLPQRAIFSNVPSKSLAFGKGQSK